MPVTTAVAITQMAVILGLVAVAVLSLVEWRSHRRSLSGWSVVAVGALAALVIAVRVGTIAPSLPAAVASIIALVASCYALLLFRARLVPVSRRVLAAVLGILVAAAAGAIVFVAVVGPAAPGSPRSPLRTINEAVLVIAWAVCVLDSAVSFWREAGRRLAVQRARLRALAVGYGAIAFIVLGAVVLTRHSQVPTAQLLLNLLGLMVLPLLWAAFCPPPWLKRVWRSSEDEEAYRLGLQQMVLFSPDRATVAARALEWSARFIGAKGALLADDRGIIVAAHGFDDDQAKQVLAACAGIDNGLTALGDGTSAVVAPLATEGGTARIIALSGPLTVLFGDDEADRLRAYAAIVAVAFERAGITERIRAVEHAKGDFLNLASHELRGPLTVLRGYLSMLNDGDFGELPGDMARVIPILVRQTDQMSLIVDQMLEAARIDDERLQLHMRDCDLREIAMEIVDEVRKVLPSTHRLVLDATSAQPIHADPNRIRTVLANLIDNAIKYSPDGGDIICHVGRNHKQATFSITDHGIGIERKDVRKLFTRFGRIVTSENAHISGTGLGLYLCRELARRHGGDVTLTPGGGATTFTLTLPARATHSGSRDGVAYEEPTLAEGAPQARRALA